MRSRFAWRAKGFHALSPGISNCCLLPAFDVRTNPSLNIAPTCTRTTYHVPRHSLCRVYHEHHERTETLSLSLPAIARLPRWLQRRRRRQTAPRGARHRGTPSDAAPLRLQVGARPVERRAIRGGEGERHGAAAGPSAASASRRALSLASAQRDRSTAVRARRAQRAARRRRRLMSPVTTLTNSSNWLSSLWHIDPEREASSGRAGRGGGEGGGEGMPPVAPTSSTRCCRGPACCWCRRSGWRPPWPGRRPR